MSGNKRKTLADYFATSPSKRPKSITPSSEQPHPSVPGLSLLRNFITSSEEAKILAFLDAQTWRTDLARRVIHYGGTYCLLPSRDASPEERKKIESNIITAPPIPPGIEWVVDRLVSHDFYSPDAKPTYCIVNAYDPGQGISAHVENFRFGEPVVGLTLSAGDHMRFHELVSEDDGSVRSGKAGKAERTGKKVDVWLERRGLVVMRGESRRKWQHEIVRGRKGGKGEEWRRVSLTFRVEKERE